MRLPDGDDRPRGELRALQTTDLRGLRLPAITAGRPSSCGVSSPPTSTSCGRKARRAGAAEYRQATLERAAPPRLCGRPAQAGRAPGDPRGRAAARLADLRRGLRDHRPPTRAVAEALGLSHSGAAKRIAQCRLAGFLGEAEHGKAGLRGMLMGRGDAATLASQIAIDEELKRRRHDDSEGVGES